MPGLDTGLRPSAVGMVPLGFAVSVSIQVPTREPAVSRAVFIHTTQRVFS